MPPASILSVPHPTRLIALEAHELTGLVAEDAAPADAGTAGAAGELDWALVGRALAQVCALLAAPPSFRRTYGLSLRFGERLADRERVVVESWMLPGISPTLDVTQGVVDGKADWLWAAVRSTTGPIPVHLSIFDEIDAAPRLSDAFRQRLAVQAQETVQALPADALWRSPLAAAALRQACFPGGTVPEPEDADSRRRGIGRLFRRPAAD